MPRQLIYEDKAKLDIIEIWSGRAKFSRRSANELIDAIEARIHLLPTLPDLGRSRPEAGDPSIRFVSVEGHRVAYAYDDDAVHVLRVVHGSLDLSTLSYT